MEHRKNKRTRCEANILHDTILPDYYHTAKMYNFSEKGLFFVSNQELLPGDEISIATKNLPLKDGNNSSNLFDVEIVWRKELKGLFRFGYGVKLVNPNGSLITIFEKAKLKGPGPADLDAINKSDPREYPRKEFNKELKFVSNNGVYRGLVTNMSRGGAFIETHNKFPLNRIIELLVPRGKSRKNIRLKGHVVRTNSKGIAIKFDRRHNRERRYDLDRRIGPDRRKRIVNIVG